MENKFSVLTLLLMISLFFSCEKSNIEFENDFDKSHRAWLMFKQSSDNSYTYKVERGSWVGIKWETTITVLKGKVVERYFKSTYVEESGGTEVTNEWTENENEINSHKDSGVAEPITLDEVYDKARNDWLVKRKNAETFFEAKNNGLLSLCGYVEDNCADDCFRGISISHIKPLQSNL